MPSGHGTILFVDDNDTLRRVLSAVLDDAGYEVLQYPDPRDARSALEAGAIVDAVICDVIVRGGGTSRDFIAYLAAAHPAVPVLVISGLGAEQTADLLGDVGTIAFLQKPFTVEDLLARATTMIGAEQCGRRSETV